MCKEAHYTPQKALLDLLTIRYTKKLMIIFGIIL